jgi:hypothetical protein
MVIKREPLMWRTLKKTAQLTAILIMICAVICAIALTIEFIMWIMDLHEISSHRLGVTR